MLPVPPSNDQIELRSDAVTRDTIDVNDGIERVMGNRALYARMLRRFRNDYGDGALPIRTAIANHDDALAHRLVHSLKGAAGMIGALRLLARATKLEESMRTGAGGNKVLQLLDALLDGSPPPGMPVQAARTLLADWALYERLLDLLSRKDGAALELLVQSQASLRVILGELTLQRVAAAAAQLRYGEALAALGETANGAGI